MLLLGGRVMQNIIVQMVVGGGVLTCAIAILLAVCAAPMRRPGAYLAGLGAACIAISGTLTASYLWQTYAADVSFLIFVTGAAPLIEEPTRLLFLTVFVRAIHDRDRWIAFAWGYAALEFGIKIVGVAILWLQVGGGSFAYVGPGQLLSPFLPFGMHIFIAVLVCSLRAARVGWPLALVVAIIVHGVHNYSIVVLAAFDPSAQVLQIAIRISLFAFGIAVCWRLAPRAPEEESKPATPEPAPVQAS